ncbi:NAD(P)H-hydrate dehydratase [Mucilaginibacter ginsenosidivorans]|uniref:Bifunctional NAD(P)H-hydrate repair enzyme n=1 Tax=Mucilaginibacter ginsenosidivorans TaxID=398053 RepID=A0A5B8UTP4_9SPHI|nr:NAD(P)H-hydrate dehydratase [Mucilaginibacter ginsenosidivorans]QEC62272.1 NAD(P)H-hydrate dehydratase [Mucilaginibacter ginsenosidivorans]
MLPLLLASQIREADAHTVAHEPIASIDLMERASKAFVGWFVNHFPDKNKNIAIYCGTGNNGGDGVAIARMLYDHGYEALSVKIARFSSRSTDEFDKNLARLKRLDVPLTEMENGDDLPEESNGIVIDALLGTGLNKPLEGEYEKLVKYLNSVKCTMVAVDIPTGFFADGEIDPDATILKADLVITFQQPKINFLLPESGPYIGCLEVVHIGLDEKFIRSLNSPYQLVEEKDIRAKLKHRKRFTNKGTYGHALIIAGQPETMGAALLSSSACAYAGAGLTTACIPENGLIALNNHQPEVMAIVRKEKELPDVDWPKFSTIAIGPGLGKDAASLKLFTRVLASFDRPVVIDADAINMLASNPDLWKHVPKGSILTPHVKEFDRLFGEHKSWWQRLQTGKQQAKNYDVYIVLKNDYTITITPVEKFYFNSTSNAAMASGGMGDVLTGIIAALLAQKYSSEDACIIGNYIHGKAGDELALPNRMYAVLPGRLITQLPVTMVKLMA